VLGLQLTFNSFVKLLAAMAYIIVESKHDSRMLSRILSERYL
jgi:hypothetical protein